MKKTFRFIALLGLCGVILSCASQQSNDDDFSNQDETAASDTASSETAETSSSDELSFDESSNTESTTENQQAEAAPSEQQTEQQTTEQTTEQQTQDQVQTQPQEDELALDEAVNEANNNEQAPTEPQPQVDTLATEPAPVLAPPTSLVEIRNLQFKGNETGGTLVIDATGPFTYTTRTNPELKQYIIEIPNSILPQKLKRPLNTKDFKGSFGSIDAYQSPGSNISRFVLQLREGAQEPVIQLEGSTLLVATNDVSATTTSAEAPPAQADTAVSAGAGEAMAAAPEDAESSGVRKEMAKTSGAEAVEEKGVLSNLNLEDFMINNKKFYGRKVSCSFEDVPTRDALVFVMLDSGLNLIIDELKTVGNINIRVREVPWDQCLVLIMKVKKLGYVRMGNVLRISTLQDLGTEERETVMRTLARRSVEPMRVRIYPISYASAKDMEGQVKNFLTEKRGSASSDTRTNSLIVTDVDDVLDKVEKMVKSLDTPPPQVLIEGKIVEATDSFQKSVGINWGFGGQDVRLGTSKGRPVNMRPSFSFGTPSGTASGVGFSLNIGTMDILGDLSATLSLFEIENKVKVLSSPRIVTMNNERASINQTTNQPQARVVTTASGTTKSYTSVPITLSLDVTPQITNDASVIMKVSVNREFAGSPVDPADASSFPKFTRRAETKVIVKNGQTSVIGGIYQNDTSEGESGISGLKDIPILGYLFKSGSSRKEKNELLIFLTPRIVNSTSSTDSESNAEAKTL